MLTNISDMLTVHYDKVVVLRPGKAWLPGKVLDHVKVFLKWKKLPEISEGRLWKLISNDQILQDSGNKKYNFINDKAWWNIIFP